MTVELIDGKLDYSKCEIEKLIREQCKQGFSFVGFNNKEEAELFIGKFPKYVKLYHCTIYSETVKHSVNFDISVLNGVTGEVNETGERRINGLLNTLVKNEMLINSVKYNHN